MTDAYTKIDVFGIWGRDYVLAVASEVLRNSGKLEVLSEIRLKQKEEIDSATEAVGKMKDVGEQRKYVNGLPLAFQSIIILDCLREVDKAISRLKGR